MAGVRLLEDLSDFEKLALIPMSYSRINQYHDWCQAKYFWQYVVKAESVSGPAALLGNVVHSVLEERLEKDTPVHDGTYDLLVEEFKKQLEIWDTERIINQTLIDDGIYILQDFVDRHSGESFPIEFKEMQFEIVAGTALIRGYIDRVDIRDNLISFVDYKTGKREVPAKHIAKNLQLGIYALALHKKFPDHQIYGELYYLRSGRQKGHQFNADDLVAIETNLVDLVYEIIDTNDFKTTPNKRLCSFCEFASPEYCRTGWLRTRGPQ